MDVVRRAWSDKAARKAREELERVIAEDQAARSASPAWAQQWAREAGTTAAADSRARIKRPVAPAAPGVALAAEELDDADPETRAGAVPGVEPMRSRH